MGEALLIKSSSDFGGGASKKVLKTEIIEADTLWVAPPPQSVDQSFSVRIFGGGGGYGGNGYQHIVVPLMAARPRYMVGGGGGYGGEIGVYGSNSTTTVVTPGVNGGNGICIIQYYVTE